MTKGSIQPGIVRGKVEVCPACGAHFVRAGEGGKKSGLSPLFCPNHPNIAPTRYRVMFGKICHHHHSFQSAHMDLVGLLYKLNAGEFDVRDYQVKAKPLSFDRLAGEWLEVKRGQVRPGAHRPLRNALARAVEAWGEANIKSITYAHVEDLFSGLSLADKTKANTLAALKQFWTWAVNRYDIPPMKAWPNLGQVEMRFRKTVPLEVQEQILSKVKEMVYHYNPRLWLAIKWLCVYPKIRPGEMRLIAEGDIDRHEGTVIIPAGNAKEGQAKIIPLLQEDIDLLNLFPPEHPSLPFFRHHTGRTPGKCFGIHLFYSTWKRACALLGINDVDLYGGTKHSSAMAYRKVATFEEVRRMTGHHTNKAAERYFRIEGDTLRELYNRRNDLLPTPDNALTMQIEDSQELKTEYIH